MIHNLQGKIFEGLTVGLFALGTFFGIGSDKEAEPQPVVDISEYQEEIRDYVDEYVKLSETRLGAITPIAGSTYTIAGSGISPSATSITLTSFTIPQTGQKLLDADLPDTFYLTLEPGNRTKQEIVSCTTVTQNSTSATLSGCSRGLAPIFPYTASTTLAFVHNGGSQVVISDPPQLFQSLIDYVNGQFFGGVGAASETATGTVEIATGAEAAASTENGTAGRLGLPASLSTSTPPASGNYIPVTGVSDGNLAEGFLPTTLSAEYAFTSTTTFSGYVDGTVASSTTKTYTSSTTWFKPNKLRYVTVKVVGGGGGGGGSTTVNTISGGGGGGGYCERTIPAANIANSVTVTVGAAGTAGAATGATGGTGGTSSFGSHCTATGGTGGNDSAAYSGGAGGVGSGGDLNITGGGGMGGANGTGNNFSLGSGGNSVLGGGAQSASAGSGDNAGNAGGPYGGGGSGAHSGGGGDTAGGIGAIGAVIVQEHY
jgi:hypothetical protein